MRSQHMYTLWMVGLSSLLLLSACTTWPAQDSESKVKAAPGDTQIETQTEAVTQTEPVEQSTESETLESSPTQVRAASPSSNSKDKVASQASNKQVKPESSTTTPPVRKPEAQTNIAENSSINTKPAEKTPAIKLSSLNGKIQIRGKRNKSFRPSNVIVSLKSLSSSIQTAPRSLTHQIDMKNKTYLPLVQTVMKGDSLEFNNHDNIKHNVFSSSGENTFDLGTFKGGSVRSVQLNHSGVVKVYCNIHPEMASFIMVSDNPLNAISDKEGAFSIAKIPPGEYELHLWHIRGEHKQMIQIKAGSNTLTDLTIDASSYERTPHKNKFGKEYDKKPALFEDEFY